MKSTLRMHNCKALVSTSRSKHLLSGSAMSGSASTEFKGYLKARLRRSSTEHHAAANSLSGDATPTSREPHRL